MKSKNRDLFDSMLNGKTKNIPITDGECIVLRTAIEKEIKFRLDSKISTEQGQDIIYLINILENIISIPSF